MPLFPSRNLPDNNTAAHAPWAGVAALGQAGQLQAAQQAAGAAPARAVEGGVFDRHSVAQSFRAAGRLAAASGHGGVAAAYDKLAVDFTHWCEGDGARATDCRIGEKAADMLRDLQHGPQFHRKGLSHGANETLALLHDLTGEMKRHYRSQSANGVIDEFAHQWAEDLSRRVHGFAALKPGAELTVTKSLGLTGGGGFVGAGIKAALSGKLGFRHKSTTVVDDDTDFNLIIERRGDAGVVAKLGAAPAANGSVEGGAYYARGKYFESDNLKDVLHVAIKDKINAQLFSAHKSSGAPRATREFFGQLSHSLSKRLGLETDVLADRRAPLHLSAEKVAKGAMNERRIQNLASAIEAAAGSGPVASREFEQLFPSFFQKIADRPDFLRDEGPELRANGLAKMPKSAPAQVAAGNPLKPGWKQKAYGGTLAGKAGVGGPYRVEGGISGELTRKELPLERLKKTHELLSWSYAGGKDVVRQRLDDIHRGTQSNAFFENVLRAADRGIDTARERVQRNLPKGLSEAATQRWESRLAGAPAERLKVMCGELDEALGQLSEHFTTFQRLQDDAHGAIGDTTRHQALASIDKLLFGGQHAQAAGHGGYGDGREFLARADDAFSVALAAVGNRFSLLKEAVSRQAQVSLDAEGKPPPEMAEVIQGCDKLSDQFARAGSRLKDAPSILEPDQLLRFASLSASSVSAKNIKSVQLNAQARFEPLAMAKATLPHNGADGGPAKFLSLDAVGISGKATITHTRSEHPNSFRAGEFIDVTIEVSAGAVAQLADVQRLQQGLKLVTGLSDDQRQRMAADARAASKEFSSRLAGTSGFQLAWRLHKLDDAVAGQGTEMQLQRLRVSAITEGRLVAKAPVGAMAAAAGAPVEASPEARYETRKVAPLEYIGADIGYQLIRYKAPPHFNAKAGFTDVPALKSHLEGDEATRTRLGNFVGDPRSIVSTLEQFLAMNEPAKAGARPSTLQLFAHENYKKPIEAAAEAKRLDAATKGIPMGGKAASPYDIPQLISREELKALVDRGAFEDSLLLRPQKQQARLGRYLEDPGLTKALGQFFSILHHYNDVGDYLKKRSYEIRVRGDEGHR